MIKSKKRQKAADELFCRSCGESIKKEAEICPHCGVRQRESFSHHGKSKTTAVLLAVFLPPFNWLYTYKKDAAKFWISIIIDTFATFLWIGGIAAGEPSIFVLGLLVSLSIWLWAIIDASVKDREWYEDF